MNKNQSTNNNELTGSSLKSAPFKSTSDDMLSTEELLKRVKGL